MKTYCGMRMTPEAMAMLGMISAHQYLEITDRELFHTPEGKQRIVDAKKADHERRRQLRAQSGT
jgi:hypothetical protein